MPEGPDDADGNLTEPDGPDDADGNLVEPDDTYDADGKPAEPDDTDDADGKAAEPDDTDDAHIMRFILDHVLSEKKPDSHIRDRLEIQCVRLHCNLIFIHNIISFLTRT